MATALKLWQLILWEVNLQTSKFPTQIQNLKEIPKKERDSQKQNIVNHNLVM